MEGDLRINVPPGRQARHIAVLRARSYGNSTTESQDANCWDESKEKGKTSELGNRF